MKAIDLYRIFESQVSNYHLTDNVDADEQNPYEEGSFEALLWKKSFVDTVQWHLEDLIRPEDVDPVEALKLKRRIDRSNQVRTDLVEHIDDFYMSSFQNVELAKDAAINTETPAWAVDRLSILALKIYHFTIEVERTDASPEHHAKCQSKLDILLQQRSDLCAAIDTLLSDLFCGRKRMVVYRQMKMYNDPSLNPALYTKK